MQDLASGAVRELVRHGSDTIFGNPHWSPDGRFITYSSNWRIGHQIYVVEVATGKERRISGLTGGGCEPRFSRDGRKVVYVSRGHMRPTSRLVEHDLATGEERALVSWPALNYDPVYSPDGTELAFASNITGEYAVYRQRLSDGQAWRVTFGPGPARYPDYRPRAVDRGAASRPAGKPARLGRRGLFRGPGLGPGHEGLHPHARRARRPRAAHLVHRDEDDVARDRVLLHGPIGGDRAPELHPDGQRRLGPRLAAAEGVLLLVEADPDPGRERGLVADEPGVGEVVRGARLARDRAA